MIDIGENQTLRTRLVRTRFLAGVAKGFQLQDDQRRLLEKRGARVINYRDRVGMLILEIDDVKAFQPPGFLRFLVPDDGVEALGEE